MVVHYVSDTIKTLVARQPLRNCTRDAEGFLDPETCYIPFWYSKTGVIIKWSTFLALTTLFMLYLVLGYWHARQRIRKGLPPLAYHRWLVPRAELARVDPRYAYAAPPAAYQTDYYMHPMPPPVYDPNAPRPPMYDYGVQHGGGGGSKIDPGQAHAAASSGVSVSGSTPPDYDAPSGPPPSQSTVRPQGTGSTNPFRG